MAERLRAHLPLLALVVLLGLAGTATLTYAAGRQLGSAPGTATVAAPTPPIVVPDVEGPGLRLRQGRARGRRVRLARRRLRPRLCREHRRLAVPGGRHARHRHRRTARHPDAEAERLVRADRRGAGRRAVRGDRTPACSARLRNRSRTSGDRRDRDDRRLLPRPRRPRPRRRRPQRPRRRRSRRRSREAWLRRALLGRRPARSRSPSPAPARSRSTRCRSRTARCSCAAGSTRTRARRRATSSIGCTRTPGS